MAIPVSDRFLESLSQAHTVSVAAAVYHPDDLATPIPVELIGGTLSADRDSRIRRQGSIDIPFTLADRFTRELARALPYGGYASVERGVMYADGETERVQLGMYRIEAVSWGELEGVATLTLADRMAQVQDEPLLAPFTAPGVHPSDAVLDLVNDVFAGTIGYSIETTPASEPVLGDAVYTDDRASAIAELAAAADAWAFFDYQGDFVLRPRATDGTPDWELAVGTDGTLVNTEESLERSSVRNGVLVRGQATADAVPVTYLATYDDAGSPLRYGGPFGHVVMLVDSQSVTTVGQAQDVAESLLRLRLGLSRTIVMRAVPNPAIEPDDVIRVELADGRTESHVVNAVQIGLGADAPMEITATTLQASPALAAVELGPRRLVVTGVDPWGSDE